MMYKIEGEDLYLIGTSEHSMIGKFIDTIIPEEELPKTLTSYSPCFRKEKGAHGIEAFDLYVFAVIFSDRQRRIDDVRDNHHVCFQFFFYFSFCVQKETNCPKRSAA